MRSRAFKGALSMAKKKKKDWRPERHNLPPFDFLPNDVTDARILTGMITDDRWIQEFIHRRRRQLIIHSIIYYRFDDNIVSDYKWQDWANELQQVQNRYPELCKIGFYDEKFVDWDGSTGYGLDIYALHDHAIAIRDYHREKYGMREHH